MREPIQNSGNSGEMTLGIPLKLLWPARSLPETIAEGEVHVWSWTFADRDAPAEEDLRILSEQELKRALRFYFAPDRVRYSVCHANMRKVLAGYLRRTPESLEYREGEGGKPALVLAEADLPLRFNLSHSKTIGLLAVTLGSEVGVDVEDLRPIEAGVAERHFSTAELSDLKTLKRQEWLEGFYRCWTRKEAILKATGVGLRIPLDSFDVSVLPEEPAALLAARPKSNLTLGWRLEHLAPAAGAIGALAVADASARIVARSLGPAQSKP